MNKLSDLAHCGQVHEVDIGETSCAYEVYVRAVQALHLVLDGDPS